MKTAIAIFFIGIFYIESSTAQSLRYPVALPYIGLSAYSKQQADPFSFTANQAALAQIKKTGIAVYGEQRFLLAENCAYRFATTIPSSLGNFGIQMDYAGFKNFNENKIGLAYARSLGSNVDVGIQFNYYGYRVPTYGNASTINFEGGAIIHFSDKLNGGVHIYNPVGGKLGKSGNEKLASVYNIGLGYDVSDNFFVSSEIIKEEDLPVNVIAGVQYHFANKFFVRLGVVSQTGSYFAGTGAGWNNLRVDVTVSYHPQLGLSPGILLMVNFEKKKG